MAEPEAKVTAKPAAKPAGKATVKPAGKAEAKATGKPAVKPAGQPAEQAAPRKITRLSAWGVIVVAYFGGLAVACVQNKVPPCMDVITEFFAIDMVTAGWLMSVFAVMGMVTAIPAAIILDRLGPMKSGVLSLAFATAGSVIGALTGNAAVLMLSRVVEGMGAGIIAIIAPALIAMWFPVDKRGLPMGVWTSWMPTGQSIMFLLAGVVSTSFGWQGVWWFTAALSVAVGILYFLKVKKPPEEHNYAPQESERISLRKGLASKPMWLICLAGFLFNIGSFSFCTWVATYWAEMLGLDFQAANIWVAVVYMIEIVMCFLAGAVLNRVKSVKKATVVGFAMYTLLVFGSFNLMDPMLLLPFVIAWAVGEGFAIAGLWTLSPQTAFSPQYVGLAAGVLSVGLNLGILSGPPLSGALIPVFGWHVTAIILAGFEVAAMFVVLAVKDRR